MTKEKIVFGETKNDEKDRQNWLKEHKPQVYEKVMKYSEKVKNGESIAIIQFQYDFACNFKCEHCCIKKFQLSSKENKKKRVITINDVKRLSKEADELGLAHWVITGGEPLIFPDFDELVNAINPEKFYLISDSNGWNLDYEKAKHLKEIGLDKIQLSMDGVDAQSHDAFRRKPGSWEKCVKAIDACKKANLHLILSTVVWKDRVNSQEFIDFLEFAKEKKVGTYITYAKPVGSYEGRYDQMLGPKEEKIIQELEKRYDIFTHLTPSYGRDIGCIAVKRMISITKYGDVMPCPYMHFSLGNILDEPLNEIIERGLNIKYFSYDNKGPCWMGVDKNWVKKYASKTYGDIEVPVDYKKIFNEDDFNK